MASRPEIVLISSLTDIERLEQLAVEGIDLEVVPTVKVRPVVEWAIDYFFSSGCKQAPSVEAMLLEWGTVLEEEEIVLGDPDEETETITWALEYLKSTYLHLQWQKWIKDAATEMASAFTGDRVDVLSRQTAELSTLLSVVRSQRNEATGMSALDAAMRRYEQRVAMDGQPHGLMFGIDLVDRHTHGIHPGELAIVAAGPKVGKSWTLGHAVLTEWQRGRRGVLFTLENSVEMTVDRIVCLHAKVSYRAWQRGECTPEQLDKVRASQMDLGMAVGDMIVIMPPKGQRTVDAMVREAQMRGADSILIDQLTFIEALQTKGKPRHEIVRDIMHDLKTEISTGSNKIPCLLAHQINREGVKAAEKTGYLEMYMLAESSEVERTADWVFGLFRSDEDRRFDLAKLQTLASRREDTVDWMLAYDPANGLIESVGQVNLRVNA